jgi:hypothetical protein
MKLKRKDKFRTAAILLFYIPQIAIATKMSVLRMSITIFQFNTYFKSGVASTSNVRSSYMLFFLIQRN